MNDQEFYKLVNEELFKNGSCKFNTWYNIKTDKIHCEAILPSKGNIRVRKPFRKSGKEENGEPIYMYRLYRFTNKKELIYEGYSEGLRSEVNEIE